METSFPEVAISWGVTRANPEEAFAGNLFLSSKTVPQHLPRVRNDVPEVLPEFLGLVIQLQQLCSQVPKAMPENVSLPLLTLDPALAMVRRGLEAIPVIPIDLLKLGAAKKLTQRQEELDQRDAKAQKALQARKDEMDLRETGLDQRDHELGQKEQRLGVRATELDTREQALVQREQALAARFRELAELESTAAKQVRALFAETERELVQREASIRAQAEALDRARNESGAKTAELGKLLEQVRSGQELMQLAEDATRDVEQRETAVKAQEANLLTEEERLAAQREAQDRREFELAGREARMNLWESSAGKKEREQAEQELAREARRQKSLPKDSRRRGSGAPKSTGDNHKT